MAQFNSRDYTSRRGLNLTAANGCIRFETPTTTPTTTTDERVLYVNGSNQLIFDDGVSATALGSSGVVSSFSLNDSYDDGNSITVDSSAVILAGSHATNDVLQITGSAATAGAMIDISNSGSGRDIEGSGDTWTISSAGAAVFTAVTGCDTLTAAANLAINATAAGTIAIGNVSTGAVTITPALVAVASITITGSADADVLTLTAGDIKVTNGILSLDSDDTTSGNLVIPSSTATSGNVVSITCDDITSGAAIYIDSDNGASFSGQGGYLHFIDGTNPVFLVGRYGATTIAGNAGSNVFTVTAGDVVLSDASITLTDADDAASTLAVHNDAATTTGAAADIGVVDIDSESLTTGVLLNLSLDETNLAGGFYLRCYGQDAGAGVFTVGEYGATVITTAAAATSLTITSASTNVDIVSITASALTTGDALYITQTAETFAAGELLKIVNTENGDLSATPKTGNLTSITSTVTATTANTALDYDALLISRSNIASCDGFTLTAAGSGLKVLVTSTNTVGTCTDTTKGIEVLMADGGTAAPTGDAVGITSVGVAAKAINVASASTTVSDVLITGSGVKANNKASLEVTNSGATAAGGSIFRVTNTGTPAAATSYLVDLDYGGATMNNNPTTVYINAKDSTASSVLITGSGAIGAGNGTLEINSTAAGAAGAVLTLSQDSASPAASDVIGAIHFYGVDDAAADQQYAKIECKLTDVAAASTDADLIFSVVQANAVVQMLTLDSDVSGIVVGTGAAAATITSSGAYDLTISTASTAANEPKIVLTDGATGNITITAGGTSGEIVAASPLIRSTVQTISNANTAIDVVTDTTSIANDAASTHTMADGVVGQRKFIFCETWTGDAVITPSNLADGTTITLNAVGDSWYGEFVGTEWHTIALVGTAAIA
jgi:hypothetical protein